MNPLAAWDLIGMVDAYPVHACVYCGRGSERLSVDHEVPPSRGGSDAAWNVVPACRSCNSSKRDRLLCEWSKAPRDRSALLAFYAWRSEYLARQGVVPEPTGAVLELCAW